MIAMLILAALHLTKTLSLASTFAMIFGIGFAISYVLPILINFRRVSVFKYVFGAITLLYLTPTYIIIMVIYAICNIHDISWGNRPDTAEAKQETAKQRRTEELFKAYRTKTLLMWIILNVLISMLVIDLSSSKNGQESLFIIAFAIFSAFVIWLRLCLALINTCIACSHISHLQRRADGIKQRLKHGDQSAAALNEAKFNRWETGQGLDEERHETRKVTPLEEEEDKYSPFCEKKAQFQAKTDYSDKQARLQKSHCAPTNYLGLPSLGAERQATARSFVHSPREHNDERWKLELDGSISDSQEDSF